MQSMVPSTLLRALGRHILTHEGPMSLLSASSAASAAPAVSRGFVSLLSTVAHSAEQQANSAQQAGQQAGGKQQLATARSSLPGCRSGLAQQLTHNNQAVWTTHSYGYSSSSNGSDAAAPDSTSTIVDGGSGSQTALQASMDKLVDTAVNLVEEGRLQQAVEVLQQGITLLSSTYPGSPELGELHNQAALLLLFASQRDAAAKHASDALEITQKIFGPTHPLTGHRLLRLGTIRFAAGQMEEARPLLATAADMLGAQLGDPSLTEALFYMNLYSLAAADGPAAVAETTTALKENFRQLVNSLGVDSMIVRLALAAHSKLVGAALDAGLALGEAAFKQHIMLQEVQDPNSAELALTLYQLATTYYAHDMLVDAGPVLQRATQLMRSHYPEEHDLMVLCKHRMGMVCAAGRDHRAATALLQSTKEHYQKQQQDHPLALEADLGLSMAKLKAINPRLSSTERAAAVDAAMQEMRTSITGMAGALGTEHLLVAAATRYLAQLSVMMGQRQ